MGTDGEHAGHRHGGPGNFDRAFAIGISLNLAFVVTEAVFGMQAKSLALLADAAHNLSDVIGLALAWGAAVLTRRIPSPNRTYGLRRTSILAALMNAILLIVAIAGIAWEAFVRIRHPEPIVPATVIAVASIGIVINTLTALLFMRGRRGDVNIRGAFLHMAADAGVSAGVVVAGIAIGMTNWLWLDPAVSLLVVAVIAAGTWGLLRDSVNLSLDAVPRGIDSAAVRKSLEKLPGVVSVHDLHIWGMSTTESALTAHVIKPEVADDDLFLRDLAEKMQHDFGIAHPTIQIERGHGPTPCHRENPAEL